MIGAIIGDIIGSSYEWSKERIKSKDFELFPDKSTPTDDSMMTLAIAEALLECEGDLFALSHLAVENMQYIGNNYPYAGYGQRFSNWLRSLDPKPYNSYGNGSAMRVSPVAYVAKSIYECEYLSDKVTEVTHNHEEGMKGARAIATATYMAIHKASKEDIRKYIVDNFYDLDFTIDEIRPNYTFHVDCMQSVPQAIESFLESNSFEDAIRNAVSLGGDSDTLAAMAGSIAEPFYGIPARLRGTAMSYLTDNMLDIVHRFESKYGSYTIIDER